MSSTLWSPAYGLVPNDRPYRVFNLVHGLEEEVGKVLQFSRKIPENTLPPERVAELEQRALDQIEEKIEAETVEEGHQDLEEFSKMLEEAEDSIVNDGEVHEEEEV